MAILRYIQLVVFGAEKTADMTAKEQALLAFKVHAGGPYINKVQANDQVVQVIAGKKVAGTGPAEVCTHTLVTENSF